MREKLRSNSPLLAPIGTLIPIEGREHSASTAWSCLGDSGLPRGKPTNLSKVTEVQQDLSESPRASLQQLLQAYWTWTPIDPWAPENQATVVLQFVSRAAPDIRKKLQKLDGFQGKSLSELVAIAQKVFDQREDPAKTTQELMQKMGKVLLAREEQPRKGPRAAPRETRELGR